MSESIPNIVHSKDTETGSPIVDSFDSEIYIPFYKDDVYFSSQENEVAFIKAVERLVRQSQDYKRYVKFIREEVGIQCCQVMSNISDASSEEERNTTRLLDMHHGPLTLFEITQVVLATAVLRKEPVTTFSIANQVIDEHFLHNVGVTMLSETAHEQVHMDNIFLNPKQMWGDTNRFLIKYREGLNNALIRKINAYVEKAKENDSYDNGVLTLNNFVKDWSRGRHVF